MVETDYAINIKREYEEKSNIIRGLNRKEGNDLFDDFKQLNKDKVVKFVEEMKKNNNRKRDNEMINLYKQMKVRNKEQQEMERAMRNAEE